ARPSGAGACRSGPHERGPAAVDFVGALLEGLGELTERLIENRAHQHAEGKALELVVDVELDVAPARRFPKSPAVLQVFERPLDILHLNFEARIVEGDAG